MSNRLKDCPRISMRLPRPRLDTVQRIEKAEAFFAGTRADIRNGGNMAYYNIDSDFVQMPPFEAFRDAALRRSRSGGAPRF
jgi:antirestriction protein ArdC